MLEYENAIEISSVTKRYEGFTLDNISFNVPKGSIMGFIGQNGAGKTTTIRSLLNITGIDGGEIRMLGLDHIRGEFEIKNRLAIVFDGLPFHDIFNASDLASIFEGLYPEWDNAVYSAYLERFGLPPKKKIGQYSKGMKMKLQIACALSHNAELLIMDEATTGLDPIVRDEILHIFMEYLQNGKRSILMSSHITGDLEKIADSITFIDKGKILLTDYKDVILETHGILKCSKDELGNIDKADIVSGRENESGAEVMLSNLNETRHKYSSRVIAPASLDDIMLYYVHKSEMGWK